MEGVRVAGVKQTDSAMDSLLQGIGFRGCVFDLGCMV
jgi:hypothetical protein